MNIRLLVSRPFRNGKSASSLERMLEEATAFPTDIASIQSRRYADGKRVSRPGALALGLQDAAGRGS